MEQSKDWSTAKMEEAFLKLIVVPLLLQWCAVSNLVSYSATNVYTCMSGLMSKLYSPLVAVFSSLKLMMQEFYFKRRLVQLIADRFRYTL